MRGLKMTENSNRIRSILRIAVFFLGIYLLYRGILAADNISTWSGIFQNPNLIFITIFGVILISIAIIPEKFVKNSEYDELSNKNRTVKCTGSIGVGKEKQSNKKDGISWEVNYPEKIPNPFKEDSPPLCDFLIEFSVKNYTEKPLKLRANLESINQGIAIVRSEVKEKWVWFPLPHKETILVWLEDQIETEVLEKGQTSSFSFHAVYRPKYAEPFYPGYLPLEYTLEGKFESGEEFGSGLQRIEIPFED